MRISALTLMILLGWVLPAADLPKVLVHGHRGARAVRPENTMAAFEYAIQAGADVLELDLAVTKDGVLAVSHDPALEPPICTGGPAGAVIRHLTFAEVRQWDCGAAPNPAFPMQVPQPGSRVPSLDEVLALAPRRNFQFNIETKSFPDRPELTPPPEEFARLVLEAVRRHKLEQRVIVQSFDFRTLAAMKKLDPSIRLATLYTGPPRDWVAMAREVGAQIAAPEKSLVTPEQVRAAHAAGLQVVPWTANTSADWDRLVAAGVDAIITDDPAALLVYLKQRGLH